jgi:hypothetical protein
MKQVASTGEEDGVVDRVFVSVCTGDQTAERVSLGGSGTLNTLG